LNARAQDKPKSNQTLETIWEKGKKKGVWYEPSSSLYCRPKETFSFYKRSSATLKERKPKGVAWSGLEEKWANINHTVQKGGGVTLYIRLRLIHSAVWRADTAKNKKKAAVREKKNP